MNNKILDKIENIPLWFLNLLTIISAISTLLGITFIVALRKSIEAVVAYKIFPAIITIFIIILIIHVYRIYKDKIKYLKNYSSYTQRTTFDMLKVYFDVLQEHLNSNLSISILSKLYKQSLVPILDNLCATMNTYTKQEICASIKLISCFEQEETIDIDALELSTFCRSNNSKSERSNYEKSNNALIKLNDNTDFLDIIDNNYGNNKGYFYQTNLIKYASRLEKEGKNYKNSNPNWKKYYRSTIVVPIQIECKRLYNQDLNKNFHVIGFLCIDSMSTRAFLEKFEDAYVDTLKSYANLLYILLGQYRHYVKKLSNMK